MQRSTVLWLVGLAVLVVVVLVVVATRSPVVYPEDTAEGVVQRYVQAVLDQDPERALGWLAPSVRDRCDTDATYDMLSTDVPESRATLLDSRTDADEATVRVRLSVAGGPFEGGYEHVEVFRLRRTSEGWRIDPAPWPIEFCTLGPDGRG